MSDTNTRTEWGVRLAWPDGHVEVRTHGTGSSEPTYSRRDAEVVTRQINTSREDGETEATAEVVTRSHDATAWMPAGDLLPDRCHDGTRVEWGQRLTWPDGHVETREANDRQHAEWMLRMAQMRLEDKESAAAPEMVGRYVTTSEWAPVATRANDTRYVATETEDGHPFFVQAVDVASNTLLQSDELKG